MSSRSLAPIVPIRPPRPLTISLERSPRKGAGYGGYVIKVMTGGPVERWSGHITWKHTAEEAIARALELAELAGDARLVAEYQLRNCLAATGGKLALVEFPAEVIAALEGARSGREGMA